MQGDRDVLDDGRWERLVSNATGLARRGPKGDLRAFLAAVVWILHTGAPWRDLAERFGRWDRVYRRYRRWALAGRWDALHGGLCSDESALPLIDSTIVKAHAHAAGALRRTGGQACEALGRSRGGFTTKLHALVRARALYARRNVIERWFGRLKGFRRIPTRYEKTTCSYGGFVAAAATLLTLTGWRG